MVMGRHEALRPVSLKAPVRNRYYFGKLLDAVHFDLEQDYFNSKRWLINRMVLGYGVVCGLDVQLAPSGRAVRVTSGLAIDKWGREIVVPSASRELDLPERPKPAEADAQDAPRRERPNGCDDEGFHLVLCYHECPSSPEPGLGDDCGQSTCTPSLVEERYKLSWKKGKAPEPHEGCLPDLLSSDGRINRRALAMHITHECRDMPCDPCLPLANLTFGEGPADVNVDITVRPIVYTNDLLFELIGAMQADRMGRPRNGK